MASLTKQEKKEKQEKLLNKIMWIPIVIMLAIVPLIIRMVIIDTNGAVMDVLNTDQVGDAYSNYKSTAIVLLCIAMGIISFLCIEKENIKWDKTIRWYVIGGGIFLGISLLAACLSDNKHTAWWGMPDRAEGFIMNCCYILMVLYVLYALRRTRNYIYMIVSLSFLIVVTTIIGVFQYFGYDPFMKVDFFKQLILGKDLMSQGMSLTSDFEAGKVIGTMVHYNYMGSFGAMMVPFFMVLTLFIENKKYKIGLGFITLCSMFLLFGSTSRAGIIGLCCAILVMIIVFAKVIIKKWKISLPVVVVCIIIVIGFNAITHGSIFARIPTLLSESVGLFSGSDENFDYRDHIPVREIVHEGNQMKLVMQEHTLYLGNDEGNLTFTDENGQTVPYMPYLMGQGIGYQTSDERFNAFAFKMEQVKNAEEGKAPTVFSMIYNEMSTFCFMLDDEKGVIMADSCPLQEEEIEYPETVGFKGKEKLGSARGYIWSRSIPMMKKTVLVGFGPDNYALKFPQRDYLGKWWAYDTPNMIVDKAHSLYMGMWINNGGLALAGFLIVMGAYLIQCFKLYAFKGYYENRESIGIATMTAVVGYLGAGFFNDSVVSVTPIFCILLGAGMGINFLINKDRNEQQKRISKVIHLK